MKKLRLEIKNKGTDNQTTRNLNEIDLQHWDRAISVMTTSCFFAIKYGSQAMAVTSQEKPQSGGSIVLTSSCAAFLGAYADIAYSKCTWLMLY